jgi:hypothetical protein
MLCRLERGRARPAPARHLHAMLFPCVLCTLRGRKNEKGPARHTTRDPPVRFSSWLRGCNRHKSPRCRGTVPRVAAKHGSVKPFRFVTHRLGSDQDLPGGESGSSIGVGGGAVSSAGSAGRSTLRSGSQATPPSDAAPAVNPKLILVFIIVFLAVRSKVRPPRHRGCEQDEIDDDLLPDGETERIPPAEHQGDPPRDD